jgi:hypothetical protein
MWLLNWKGREEENYETVQMQQLGLRLKTPTHDLPKLIVWNSKQSASYLTTKPSYYSISYLRAAARQSIQVF